MTQHLLTHGFVITPIFQTKVPTTNKWPIIYLSGHYPDSSPKTLESWLTIKRYIHTATVFLSSGPMEAHSETLTICPAPSRTVLVILSVLE